MRFGLLKQSPWLVVLASAGWLSLVSVPASAQDLAWGGHKSCPPAPCPAPELAPTPAPTPAPVPSPELAQPPSTELALDQRFAGLGGETVSVPNMIGDLGFSSSSNVSNTAIAVRASSFKVANNENARPQDRIYVTFNYFNDINRAINIHNGLEGVEVGKIDAYSEGIGFEKTFFDGNVSIGLRLPLDTVHANGGRLPGTGGDFTDIGDLTIITKAIIWQNRSTGSLLSGGLAVTAPTGPHNFAGAPATIISDVHDTLIQPYLAYLFVSGNFYLQGFESVIVATDSNDVTLLCTDIGAGYYMVRDRSEGRLITAIVPTVEMHLNDPLNHRGAFSSPLGVSDWLVLTQGVIVELNRRSLLTIGVGEPVTGPRPYAVEAIAQFNWFF